MEETDASGEAAEAVYLCVATLAGGAALQPDVLRAGVDAAEAIARGGDSAEGLWRKLARKDVRPLVVAQMLGGLITAHGEDSRESRLAAARMYAALIAARGSPALGLFDEVTWASTMAVVRTSFHADREGARACLENLGCALGSRLSLATFKGSVSTTLETVVPLTYDLGAKEEDWRIEAWRASYDALYAFLAALAAPGNCLAKAEYVVLMRSIQPTLNFQFTNKKAPQELRLWLRVRALRFLRELAHAKRGTEDVVLTSIGALARHCCLKAPENAESRDYAAMSVSEISLLLPESIATGVFDFLGKLCKHPQTNQRAFALEVLHKLAEGHLEGTREAKVPQSVDWKAMVPHIVDRTGDKNSSIRVKAIACLVMLHACVAASHADHQPNEGTKLPEGFSDTSCRVALGRCRDVKPTVRKAAMQLMEQICVSGRALLPKCMQALVAASNDPFVSVRRQAALTASSLHGVFPASESCCRMWMQIAFPLCLDAEPSIQAKCIEIFEKDFLRAIQQGRGALFLATISAEGSSVSLLNKIFSRGEFNRAVLKGAINALVRTIERNHGDGGGESESVVVGSWIVLSEVLSRHPKLVRANFVESQLSKLGVHVRNAKVFGQVMNMIKATSKGMGEDARLETRKELAGMLSAFTIPVEAIAQSVGALGSMSSGREDSCIFIAGIVDSAERIISESMHERNFSQVESKVVNAVFTLGELSLLPSFRVGKRSVLLVQSIASDALLSSGVRIPHAVQAHSWASLGKFCFSDENLAKRCIPLFFQEIGNTEISAVRNNIMLILADLCMQYTSLVDAHIGKIAMCFKDPSEVVRRQTLVVLASLLMQDYVKWRGPVFHCFLLSLVDDSQKVRSLGSFLLSTSLSHRASVLAQNHMVQTMFALNGQKYASDLGNEMEKQAIVLTDLQSIQGADSQSRTKRMTIYHHLLKRMSSEHKFAVVAKICQDCLTPLVEGARDLESHFEILRDALIVLASSDMKVSIPSREEAEEDAAVALVAAKGKVVSSMMKKHMVEAIVPLIIELKRLFESLKSPLLGLLMNFACAMLAEHKTDIEEILVADPTFAKEIVYELQQDKYLRKPLECMSNRPESSMKSPPTAGMKLRSPVGTTRKTPLAAEVLADEGLTTSKRVQQHSEKKYQHASSDEVRRLSSLFNAVADN